MRDTARESLDLLKRAQEVLLILGAVLYAAVRLAYDGFYGYLGIDPVEVGVTYSEIVSRAALGTALIGSGIAIGSAIVLTVQGLLAPEPSRGTTASELRRIVAHVGLLLVGVAIVIVVASPLLGIPALLGASTTGTLGALMTWVGWSDMFVVPERRTLRRFVAFGAGAFAVAATLIGFEQWGESKAAIIVRNQPLRSQPLIGILTQPAELVCVAWIDGNAPMNLRLDRPMVFLGRAEGVSVFYMGGPASSGASAPGSVRLPTSRIVIRAATSTGAC